VELYVQEKRMKKGGWLLVVLSVFLLLSSGLFFAYTKFPSFFKTRIYLDRNSDIGPCDPVTINFSRPLALNIFDLKVGIYPEKEIEYHFEDNNKKLVIVSKDSWILEEDYEISISGRNFFLYPLDEKIYFKTSSYPKLVGFYPAQGEKDVILDIEDPIRAYFDGEIDKFKVRFAISPYQEMASEIEKDTNVIKLLPKEELERGKKFNVSIYIRHKDEKEEDYRKANDISFETKPLAPPDWDKDFAVRLEQAKKFTEAKIREGKYIDINLKSQILSIFENGKIIDTFLVSSGKIGMETPQGSFQVHNKYPRAWSKKYGLYMPYWMAIVNSGDFGIHELPEWPGGYKEGKNHLGIPVSHGCVRLGIGSAERVYNFAEIGTPVIIHS